MVYSEIFDRFSVFYILVSLILNFGSILIIIIYYSTIDQWKSMIKERGGKR